MSINPTRPTVPQRNQLKIATEMDSVAGMRVWVVLKSPIDMPDTFEFVGTFTAHEAANAAVCGCGTYTIAEMQLDRRYSGDLLQVQIMHKLSSLQFK